MLFTVHLQMSKQKKSICLLVRESRELLVIPGSCGPLAVLLWMVKGRGAKGTWSRVNFAGSGIIFREVIKVLYDAALQICSESEFFQILIKRSGNAEELQPKHLRQLSYYIYKG